MADSRADDGDDEKNSTSTTNSNSTFEDPLGVCKTDTETENDDYDFDQYYLSQISPSSSRLLADADGSLFLNFKKPPINKDISYLSFCKDNQCEHHDNLLDSDKHDLKVNVDNPEKHVTTMESFITFRITTTSTRVEYENKDYQVRRRYNDFLWLRHQLEEQHPTHLVPPLPEKHSFRRLDRFNQDFVSNRMTSLNTFLQRITKHPVLSFNKSLQLFLTNKQWEFKSIKSKDSSTIMSRLAGSLHNLGSSLTIKNRPKEFSDALIYLNKLAEKLHAVEKIASKILKEQNDMLTEMNELGPVFTLWSNSEDRLAPPLVGVARSIERSYLSLHELVETTESSFLNPIHEYLLYIDAIKIVLSRRDALQMDYENALDDVVKKQDDKNKQTSDDVKRLSRKADILSDRLTCANADLLADLERWHANKKIDFKQIFGSMADRQIKYYQSSLAAWEDTLPKIKKTLRESEEIIKIKDTKDNATS